MAGRVQFLFLFIVLVVSGISWLVVNFFINRTKIAKAELEAAQNIDNNRTEVKIQKIKEKEKNKINKIKKDRS